MYRIIQTRNIWYAVSGIFLIASIAALIMWGLRVGIDFTGGTLLQIAFTQERPESGEATALLSEDTALNLGQVTVQPTGEKEHVIKMRPITNEEREKVLAKLSGKFGEVSETRFESIGPSVGNELKRKAYSAVILVLLAIIAYISWAFRKVSQGPVPSYAYGISAIIALAHDLFVVIGVFSVLGFFRGVEIDSLFITALLTILGFSVHDTIVVYDRIREQLKTGAGKTFEEVINNSINATLVRSIGTSFSTLLVLAALYFFSSASIQYFIIALIVGIIAGTYSSIFIASPLLLVWEKVLRRRSR